MDINLNNNSQTPHIVAITGAGISTASGLPTLSAQFHHRPLHELFQMSQAMHHRDEYHRLYRALMAQWLTVKPNAAHHALARYDVRIITQNIDGLHESAGSQQVLSLHGSLTIATCLSCHTKIHINTPPISPTLRCGICGDVMWPDLVLEGQNVRHFAQAVNWVSTCDILLIIGTRLKMYPVNQLPFVAKATDAMIYSVEENAEKTLPALLQAITSPA